MKKTREKSSHVYRVVREYSNYDQNAFSRLVQAKGWETFDGMDDVEEMWNLLYNKVYNILSVMCPFVTTVPLSVCYGALNLLVLADTSNFVPYVCDRATGGNMRARKAPYPRPLFPVVAWQRNGRTVLGRLSHLLFPSGFA